MSPQYPIWTMVTSGDLPAGIITQMARDVLVEDGHGGGHVDLLPARFFVDYTTHGTCRFQVNVYSTAEGVNGPSATLSVLVDGKSTSNRWTVTLTPGPYEISPSATDGCTYLVTVNTITTPPG